MTKTIVVPLDGSPLAERAIPMAGWLGRELGAELHLLTVTLREDDPSERAYLQEQAGASGAPDVVTELITHRFAGAGVAEAVERLPDPVLCMTTRGTGGLAEVLLGSVSDEVLRAVQVPAVLIGPHCSASEPPSTTVVVAIDNSDHSLAVLPTVADWTHRLGLTAQVVTVAACGITGLPDPRADAAHRLVDEAVAELGGLGVDAERHVLNSAYPGDSIVAFATGLPAAMIATGTHGRGHLSAQAFGSTATHIVRHSPCPVLVRRIPG